MTATINNLVKSQETLKSFKEELASLNISEKLDGLEASTKVINKNHDLIKDAQGGIYELEKLAAKLGDELSQLGSIVAELKREHSSAPSKSEVSVSPASQRQYMAKTMASSAKEGKKADL